MSWLSRLTNTFRPSQLDRGLDEELRFHLDERSADLMAHGLDRDRATAQALRELGGPLRHRETSRDIKLIPWLDGLFADIRHSARRLRKTPGFSVAAVTTLALGIAGVTTIFALVNAVVIQPLPYPEPDRLVAITQAAPGLGLQHAGLSSGTYFHYRAHAPSIESLGVYEETVLNLDGPDAATERVNVTYADPSFFAVLNVKPALGRLFTDEDGRPGFMDTTWAVPVLLSHELWADRFGRDPTIVGRTITIGHPRLVVGILPAAFAFPRPETDVWELFEPPQIAARFASAFDYKAIARLRPGVDARAATDELRRILPSIQGAYPDATRERIAQVQLTPTVVPLKDEVVGGAGASLWLLFGGMGFLLLVACANVANLSLLRADGRRGEMALRVALGARAAEVIRLLASEAALVSAAGVTLGVVLARVALGVTIASMPVPFPRLAEARVGGSVLAFSALLGVFAAFFFSGLPFLTESADLKTVGALKAHGRSGAKSRRSLHARHAFVAVQVAFALTLLAGAALMAQSFWRLTRVDPGFDATNMLTVEIGLPHSKAGQSQQVFGGLLDRLRALPGVRSAAAVSSLPLDGGTESYPLAIEGHTPTAGDVPVTTRFIMPGYFDTMNTSIVEGVGLAIHDRPGVPNPVVVSAALARRLFAGQDAVGRQIARFQADGKPVQMFDAGAKTFQTAPPFTIVGVAADVRERSLRADPPEMLYIPILDPPVDRSIVTTDMSLVIRSDVAPLSLASTVRQTIRQVEPTLSIARIRTMDAIVRRSRAADSFLATLLLVASAASLFLGVIGVYSVVAQSVQRREREIGIRIALGAEPGRLVGHLLKESVSFVIAGAAAGLIIALVATSALRAFLFDVSATDPLTLVLVTLLLVAVALLAAFLPARRAVSGDPIAPIRAE